MILAFAISLALGAAIAMLPIYLFAELMGRLADWITGKRRR